MDDSQEQYMAMSADVIGQFLNEGHASSTRAVTILSDHFTGLRELSDEILGLTCSLYSNSHAVVSLVERLVDTCETEEDKLIVPALDIQTLASMILINEEVKYALISDNICLTTQ